MKRLVKASVSGDWFPNSSLMMVHVPKSTDDVEGYYELLGVDVSISTQELKSKAKELLMESHPDRGGDPDTFMQVHEAYEALSNEQSRAAYDARRKEPEAKIVTRRSAVIFTMPSPAERPAFYKDMDALLTADDIELVYEWIDLLMDVAHEFHVSLEIKAGVSTASPGYSVNGDIAVIQKGLVPERWGALTFILREMSKR